MSNINGKKRNRMRLKERKTGRILLWPAFSQTQSVQDRDLTNRNIRLSYDQPVS